MRLLIEIVIFGALIYLGWEIPFEQRVAEIRNKSAMAEITPTPVPVVRPTPVAVPISTPITDANHRTVLDTPAPKPVATVQPSGAPKPGSWMFDPGHKSPLDPANKPATPSPR